MNCDLSQSVLLKYSFINSQWSSKGTGNHPTLFLLRTSYSWLSHMAELWWILVTFFSKTHPHTIASNAPGVRNQLRTMISLNRTISFSSMESHR